MDLGNQCKEIEIGGIEMCEGSREMTEGESIRYIMELFDKEIGEISNHSMSSMEKASAIQIRENIIMGHLSRLSVEGRRKYVISVTKRIYDDFIEKGILTKDSRDVLDRMWNRLDMLNTAETKILKNKKSQTQEYLLNVTDVKM